MERKILVLKKEGKKDIPLLQPSWPLMSRQSSKDFHVV